MTLGSGMHSSRLSGLPKTLSALGSGRDPLALGSCRGLSLLLMSGKGPPGSQFWQNLLGSQGLTRARSALGSGKGSSRLSGLARAIGPNHAVFSHNQFKESSAVSFSYSNSICFDCRLRLGVGCRSRRRSTKETVTPSDGFWRHFDRLSACEFHFWGGDTFAMLCAFKLKHQAKYFSHLISRNSLIG